MKKEDHEIMLQNLNLYKLAIRWRAAIRKYNPWIKNKEIEHTNSIYWDHHKSAVYPVNWVFAVENHGNANPDYEYERVKTEVLMIPITHITIFLRLMKIAKNRSMQRYRLRKIVRSWLDHNYKVAFVTLNPASDFFNLKENVRRKYISKFLSDMCLDYFANVDYSPKTGREHYHACCVFQKNEYHKTYIDDHNVQHYEFDNFQFGFNDIEFLYNDDYSKITDYVNKLVNHAIKSSTGKIKNIMRKKKKA